MDHWTISDRLKVAIGHDLQLVELIAAFVETSPLPWTDPSVEQVDDSDKVASSIAKEIRNLASR